MDARQVYDAEKHVHFLTFSCYKRRRYLDSDPCKRIVIGQLGSRLALHAGLCLGYVIMPDHVHCAVWFPEVHQLSLFMNKWKDQSSQALKALFRNQLPEYWNEVHEEDSIWQARYYDFNLWNRRKIEEKLDYMHLNPVRAGLVQKAIDWPWSSARWYVGGRSVGIPIHWPPGLED